MCGPYRSTRVSALRIEEAVNLRGRHMRLHNVRMQVLEPCAKHRVDCLEHVRSLSVEPCAQGEACAAGSTHRKGRQ
eukprot:7101193-Prymnesium_polylepis.1